MTLPFELYTIKVYDHTGTFVLFLQKWSSLEFHQRINAPWNHQITLEFGYDDPDLVTLRSIQPDWIFEVYRIDPITLVKSKVYEGFHQTLVDQVRVNGGIILNLYGSGYTNLLQRRVVEPPTGYEYSTKTGNAETVIKEYVSDCLISPADNNRIAPGFSISANLGAGDSVSYSARYTNLLSVCETVSEQGNLDFGVYGGTAVGNFVFDAREIWGKDSREGNVEGNDPVVFSTERDNMLIPILSQNYSAEQNFAYVGGEGQGADRVIQQVYDPVAIVKSPWSRKEVFVEARQQGDTSSLIAVGSFELQQRKATQSLSFNIRQTDSSRWIRDWNLGDWVTAKYYDYSFDKRIVEIGVKVSGISESVDVQVEDLKI
ncbi:MAG: siphovirus ReqiPepy6 Gp37-like family protein [Bacilli bacterium]